MCAFSFSRRFNVDNMAAVENVTAAALLAKHVFQKRPCATKYAAGMG